MGGVQQRFKFGKAEPRTMLRGNPKDPGDLPTEGKPLEIEEPGGALQIRSTSRDKARTP